jgi:hypothetical protein
MKTTAPGRGESRAGIVRNVGEETRGAELHPRADRALAGIIRPRKGLEASAPTRSSEKEAASLSGLSLFMGPSVIQVAVQTITLCLGKKASEGAPSTLSVEQALHGRTKNAVCEKYDLVLGACQDLTATNCKIDHMSICDLSGITEEVR